MTSVDDLKVDLRGVTLSQTPLSFSLDNVFFETLEQDEIVGGNVVAELRVHKGAADIFTLDLSVRGQVVVQCDRCLDDLSLPVELNDTIKVRYADADDEDYDVEVKTLPWNQRFYDVSWDIYEAIVLSFPLQRMHPEGECNAEMIQRLESHGSHSDEEQKS